MEQIAEREAFITLKDHKPNFQNDTKCRLLNPANTELGKVSKKLTENLVEITAEKTKVNIWRSTQEVLDWFSKIEDKNRATFVVFDIIDFNPSIPEELLKKAIEHAEKFQKVSDLEKEVTMHTKKSILFNNGKAWIKKRTEKRKL